MTDREEIRDLLHRSIGLSEEQLRPFTEADSEAAVPESTPEAMVSAARLAFRRRRHGSARRRLVRALGIGAAAAALVAAVYFLEYRPGVVEKGAAPSEDLRFRGSFPGPSRSRTGTTILPYGFTRLPDGRRYSLPLEADIAVAMDPRYSAYYRGLAADDCLSMGATLTSQLHEWRADPEFGPHVEKALERLRPLLDSQDSLHIEAWDDAEWVRKARDLLPARMRARDPGQTIAIGWFDWARVALHPEHPVQRADRLVVIQDAVYAIELAYRVAHRYRFVDSKSFERFRRHFTSDGRGGFGRRAIDGVTRAGMRIPRIENKNYDPRTDPRYGKK